MKIAPTLALLALCPFAAFAEENQKASVTPAPETAPKSDKIGLYVIGYGAYQAPADLSHGGTGTVQRTTWDGEVAYTGPVGDDTTLDLDYEAKWTHNRFSDVAPYGDTESHFMGAHAVHMFEKTWGVGVVGAVELASETAADLLGDGVRGGAGASVMWKPSNTLSMETGASIQTQFGQRATPSPYIRWKWLAAKNLELEFRATGLQNGFSGTWFITDNKATSVRVSVFYENAQYALREGAGADGVAIREIPLRVTFTQFLNESFFVSLRAEAMLFHREGFYRDDEKVGVFQTNFAPGIGLMAGLRL
jgi:hypothetical protein